MSKDGIGGNGSSKKTRASAVGSAEAAGNGHVELSNNARVVLEKRYLRKDDSGEIVESPEGMFRRVAHAIAQPELLHGSEADADLWEEKFYDVMARLEFVPNSPTLMNAGIHQPGGPRHGHSCPPAS